MLITVCATAQLVSDKGLRGIVEEFKDAGKRLPAEKLYMQFDKSYYFTGDTLRFKAYLLNADFLTPSLRSGLLYVELDDRDNKMVKRIMLPLAAGISWGDMVLDGKEFPEGNYTLRGYTNWMRNFNEDYVFTKSFYIAPVTVQSLLVKSVFKTINKNGTDKIEGTLQFTSINKLPFSMQDMQLRVKQGTKTLHTDNVTTDLDGLLKVSFNLPEAAGADNLFLIATIKGHTPQKQQLIIPVLPERPRYAALNFFPEGGRLVAGILSHVAFRATTESGKAVRISGKIYNSSQQQVAVFSSSGNGTGAFELLPKTGETYTGVIDQPFGNEKKYPLPDVSTSGTTLSVKTAGADSLIITTTNTPQPGAVASMNYYLIGQARGVICYAGLINFNGNTMVKKNISRKLFPGGISRFSLLSADRQVLNERLIYNNNDDALNQTLNVTGQGDSILVYLDTKEVNGKPKQGNFCLSVTNNDLAKADTTTDDMIGYLLLTSNLINDNGAPITNAAKGGISDNLILTQKPLGYSWAQVFDNNKKTPAYIAEPDFTVSGRLTNFLNKPVPGIQVIIMGGKSPVQDTVTDQSGRFVFRDIFPVDSAVFKLQARTKSGKQANVNFIMDEFKPPLFARHIKVQQPWYVNSDSLVLNKVHTQIAQQQAYEKINQGHRLQEVTIIGKKIIRDSKNLNGPGGSDQTLDVHDIEKEGRATLFQLLVKDISGFKVSGMWYNKVEYLMLYEKRIHFVINGFDLDDFYERTDVMSEPEEYKHYMFLKAYLDTYNAGDVTGIEVMYRPFYTQKYQLYDTDKGGYNPRIAYIEITTRSGRIPTLQSNTSTLVIKTLAFSLPKPFYRDAAGADATVYWQPNLVSDTTGKARAVFYNNKKYEVLKFTVEGITDTGDIGSLHKTININK